MIGHPGKKLLFMGQDFGQYQEWSEERELDWYLLREENHQQLQNYVKELLKMYKKSILLYMQTTAIIRAWSGLMPMMQPEAFTALCGGHLREEIICYLLLIIRLWQERIIG